MRKETTVAPSKGYLRDYRGIVPSSPKVGRRSLHVREGPLGQQRNALKKVGRKGNI